MSARDIEAVRAAIRRGYGCGHDPVPDDGECLHEGWHALNRIVAESDAARAERERIAYDLHEILAACMCARPDDVPREKLLAWRGQRMLECIWGYCQTDLGVFHGSGEDGSEWREWAEAHGLKSGLDRELARNLHGPALERDREQRELFAAAMGPVIAKRMLKGMRDEPGHARQATEDTTAETIRDVGVTRCEMCHAVEPCDDLPAIGGPVCGACQAYFKPNGDPDDYPVPKCQTCGGAAESDESYALPENNGVHAYPVPAQLCQPCAYLLAEEVAEWAESIRAGSDSAENEQPKPLLLKHGQAGRDPLRRWMDKHLRVQTDAAIRVPEVADAISRLEARTQVDKDAIEHLVMTVLEASRVLEVLRVASAALEWDEEPGELGRCVKLSDACNDLRGVLPSADEASS